MPTRTLRLLLTLAAAYLLWDAALVRRARAVERVVLSTGAVPVSSGECLDLLTFDLAGLPDFVTRFRASGEADRIGAALSSYDLALLQEDFVWHERLVRATAHPFVVDPAPGSGAGFGDGLSAVGRLSVESSEHVSWTAAHGYLGRGFDQLAEKGYLHVHALLPSGAGIDLFTLHADGGESEVDHRARRLQLRQLADAIEAKSSTGAVIVAGNFNLHPSRPKDMATLEEFEARCGLSDAALALGIADDHVDRVLFRSGDELGLEPVRWNEALEFRDDEGRPLSDHAPIHVRFRVVRNEPAPPGGR